MDGLIHRYFLIISVRILGRAILYTGSTTGAFILKNIPWLLRQGYPVVPYLSLYAVDFSIGEDFYIGVPADLDQLWREYSHGALVGWKGLVQLRHMAANAWPFFNQVHLEPGGGEIKRGLNAADSSTNNHYVSKITVSETLCHRFSNLFSFHVLVPHRQACAVAGRRRPEATRTMPLLCAPKCIWLVQIQLHFALIAFHRTTKHSVAAFGTYITGIFVSNPFLSTELSSIRDGPENDLFADGHGEIVNVTTGKFPAFMTTGVPLVICAGPDLTLATMHKPFIR